MEVSVTPAKSNNNTHEMFALGCIFLVASAVAHPAPLDARQPIIDYELPLGYYPPAPLLRTSMPVFIEEPKGEKHEDKVTVAAIGDAPILPPLNFPMIHEVVIENEPKKKKNEKASEKLDKTAAEKPAKPEEEKPTIIKLEDPRIVRLTWPSWLPNIFNLPEVPVVSNVLSFANQPTTILHPANYRTLPVVLK